MSYVWVLTERSWSLRPARWVLSGWQLSGVTSFVSGDATDITGTPSQGARVVLTGDPVLPKGERTFSRNFNTGVVQAPAVGTIGSAARTNIRGPGMNNLDLSLQKNHTQFSGLDIFGEFTGVEKRFGCDYLLATNQEHWPQMNADRRMINADKALRIPNRWYDTISWFWLSPFRAVLPAEFGEIRKIPLWSASMIDHQTVSPMFCPACGHARTPDAKICEKCKERLQVSFRRGLALPPTFDVSSAESSAMRQWDSVAHLQLVVAIEDEFGIELGPADVVDLKSFASAVTILQRHGVGIGA